MHTMSNAVRGLTAALAIAMVLIPASSGGMLHSPVAPSNASCHEHSLPSHDPVPVSYACCQTGHNFAQLPAVVDGSAVLQCSGAVSESPAAFPVTSALTAFLAPIFSGDPPGILPLRI